MSKKEYNGGIDFQSILEELEKIPLVQEDMTIKEQFMKQVEAARAEAKADVEMIYEQLVDKNIETLDGVPEPLTRSESEAFDLKYEQGLEKIELIKRKIKYAEELLKDRIREEGAYELDLSNRIATKKAAKRFFKESKSFISYEDYLEAREFRDAQNEKEVEDLKED